MDLFHDISVIIFNLEDNFFLERCIRSSLAQTLPGYSFEVLLVTKKEQEISRKVIEHYKEHITPIYVTANAKFQKALDEGLNNASGRYILLVEANDFLSDYCLLVESIFLYDNPTFNAVSVDYWMVDRESDSKIKRLSATDQPLLFGVMYRKEIILKEFIDIKNQKDLTKEELKVRLMQDAKIGHIPISFYRRQMSEEESLINQ